jgi:hypothetical protein
MKKFLSLLIFFALITAISAQSGKSNVLESLEQGSRSGQQAPTATLRSAARLFGDRNDLTTVITIIPSGSHVTILDSDSTYYKVSFEDNEGYIYRRQAVIDSTPSAITGTQQQQVEQNQNTDQDNQADNNQDNQQSRFSYLENKYGTSLAARINAGKIWKGMTAEMVRDSWGNPITINKVISGNTIKEEWVYKNTWLYIQNNTLVQWGPVRR